ncbi:hypothetical protein ACIOC2_18360 [Streptomyces sp. NPDC088337]|uniref:hypothetical protein n=2 Tax=Streptomyces TaxID=1883 RepID=UPI001F16EEDE|nr:MULTISPECIES: hypothetical protein [unclassified Streptomyces]WSB27201.1 hypothetical protein OIE49_15600 [Streptomyces sp. NBC_01788]
MRRVTARVNLVEADPLAHLGIGLDNTGVNSMGMKDKNQDTGEQQRQQGGRQRPGEGREKAGQRPSQPRERGRHDAQGTPDEMEDRLNQDYDR